MVSLSPKTQKNCSRSCHWNLGFFDCLRRIDMFIRTPLTETETRLVNILD